MCKLPLPWDTLQSSSSIKIEFLKIILAFVSYFSQINEVSLHFFLTWKVDTWETCWLIIGLRVERIRKGQIMQTWHCNSQRLGAFYPRKKKMRSLLTVWEETFCFPSSPFQRTHGPLFRKLLLGRAKQNKICNTCVRMMVYLSLSWFCFLWSIMMVSSLWKAFLLKGFFILTVHPLHLFLPFGL